MKNDVIKAIMHPLRIKIIQELSLKKSATTKEIQSACGDCSQASLYRHLKSLLEYEIIEVIHENNINGILEKVYALKSNSTERIIGNPKSLTEDDYLNMFSQFTISLLSDFSSYLKQEKALENIENHIGFSSSTLLLTDEEMREMFKEISEIFKKNMHNPPAEGRKMRKVSQIVTTTIPKKSK